MLEPQSELDQGLERISEFRAHVVEAIGATQAAEFPFRHLYIEHVLPPSLYEAIKARMFWHKYHSDLEDRRQDSQAFVNRRYSLVNDRAPETKYLRALFSDSEVKLALLKNFFIAADESLANELVIHEEFEYMYTTAGRVQEIHVDIPPKFLSFIFYFPEREVDVEAERQNATVLYDQDLQPHYAARYQANSVCVFAPHLYSYHGFSSTIDRAVLVMFLVSSNEMERWRSIRDKDLPPFVEIRDLIADKLRRHPHLEYGDNLSRIALERQRCKINAPKGRVMRS